MLTVFFVHGTGVRRQAYDDLYALLNRQFAERYPDATVSTCYWGDECGARLHHRGVSIPRFTPVDERALEVEEDPHLELWARLYVEPFYELQVLAVGAANSTAFTPGESAIDDVVDRLRQWAPGEEMTTLAADGGLGAELTDARDAVLDSDPFPDAISAVPRDDGDALADLLGRAIVAHALRACSARGRSPLAAIDPDIRDRLATRIGSDLAGRAVDADARAITTLLTAPITGLLSLGGTFYVQWSRGDVFDSATPVAGDIVLYQTRGEPLVNFIRNTIKDAPRPLVLLSHSLGGVACFDMLASAARAGQPLPVDMLVTVGSQAPYLYEIGASRSLLPDEPLPAGFPAWLNVYAPRDFLSYRAREIFPDAIDAEINLRQPFPRSHSSYWASREFWAALDNEFRSRAWV